MLAYIIKSSLLLAVLYGGFALLLSRETFHRFNRIALLSVLVASMVLPLIRLTIQKPQFLCYEKPEAVQAEQQSDSKKDAVQADIQYAGKNGGIAYPYTQNGWITDPSEQVMEAFHPSLGGDRGGFSPGGAVGGCVYLIGFLASLDADLA